MGVLFKKTALRVWKRDCIVLKLFKIFLFRYKKNAAFPGTARNAAEVPSQMPFAAHASARHAAQATYTRHGYVPHAQRSLWGHVMRS